MLYAAGGSKGTVADLGPAVGATATPTPTVAGTAIPIACKEDWKDQWVQWSEYQAQYLDLVNDWVEPWDESADAANQFNAHYYDATMHNLVMPYVVGDTSTIIPRLPALHRAYRDGYLQFYNSNANGYTVFTGGLRKDWELNADATSKQYVYDLSRNAAFANGNPINTFDPNGVLSDGGARENSYRIMAELDARALGFTPRSNLDAYLDQALAHLLELTASHAFTTYTKPFMVAIIAKALIQAYEEYPEYPNRSSIQTTLVTAYDWIWDNTWVPYSVGDIKSRAFLYALPDGTEGETGGQPDLNGLILPPFGWLYKQTLDTKWRTRGDEILCGSITVVDEDGFHVRGPDFSSVANAPVAIAGKKQFNQTYQWSNKYISWAEEPYGAPTPTPTPSPTPTRTPTPTATSGGYNPQSFYNTPGSVRAWYDFTDSSKVLNVGGTPATNGQEIITLTDASGNGITGTGSGGSAPVVATNSINTNMQSAVFNTKYLAVSGLNSVVKNTSKVALGVVLKSNDNAQNHYLMRMYDASYSFNRFRPGVLSGNVNVNVTLGTSADTNVFSTSTSLSESTWHILYITVDTANNLYVATLDGASLTNSGGVNLGSPGSIANTDGNEARIGINGTGNFSVADYHIAIGEFMDNTQKANWRSALQSKLGL